MDRCCTFVAKSIVGFTMASMSLGASPLVYCNVLKPQKLGKEIRLSPLRFNSKIVLPAETWDQWDCCACLKCVLLLHRDFALWVWWDDNSDGCASQLCQHFSPPRPWPLTTNKLTYPAPRQTNTLNSAVHKYNPLLHTYTNCLQLEVAAMTFLWEMKISGGAEQPILDSVVN